MNFTIEELKALYKLIYELSGNNPENVFAHDGTDSLDDPTIRVAVKLYTAVGAIHNLPDNLRLP